MELENLVGKHILSGVETGEVERPAWSGSPKCNYFKFCLDGISYMAVEDPSDGYRSYCDDLEIVDEPCKISIPSTEVVATYRGEGEDILALIDCETGKVVLEVGTGNTNDYYPYCVMEWSPENLACNN